jgi:hypothetical protein
MRRITLADRLRYWFDNTISRGTVALIGWLFAVVAALVLTSSLFVYATGIARAHGFSFKSASDFSSSRGTSFWTMAQTMPWSTSSYPWMMRLREPNICSHGCATNRRPGR